jgi:flagellar hook-associated protein 2
MSSSTSSLPSLITVATFSGQSKFAADFQNVLSRAVQLQSLNLQSLQVDQANETARQNALQSLDSQFSSLQSAVDNLTTAASGSSLASSISNSSVGTVALSTGATPGTYSIEVQSVGSHTQTVSSSGLPTVTDPNSQNISTSSSYTLSVGGVNHPLSLATNSLQSLANAINGDSTLGVSATIVNVGSNGSNDYRIALQSTALGNVSVQLNDGSQNLLTTVTTGTPASYKVDGLPNIISSNSDTVTIGPGVSVNLTGANVGAPATITVNQDQTTLMNSVQAFAKAYNAVVDQLTASHGQNGNALQGDSVLSTAQSALRSITGYNGGSGTGLSTIGLDMDDSGHLTFNPTEFDASSAQGSSVVLQFLGDSTTGFLSVASSAMQSLEDPVNGFIKTEEQQIATNLTNMASNINDEVDKINAFQQNLLSQLSASDAAIYQLQSQQTLYAGLFNNNNNNGNSNG